MKKDNARINELICAPRLLCEAFAQQVTYRWIQGIAPEIDLEEAIHWRGVFEDLRSFR